MIEVITRQPIQIKKYERRYLHEWCPLPSCHPDYVKELMKGWEIHKQLQRLYEEGYELIYIGKTNSGSWEVIIRK